jgi:hypothetical protein
MTDTEVQQRWTRWHSDEWTAMVELRAGGEWRYDAWQGPAHMLTKTAASKVAAMHAAEDVVRHSGHRCTARCSFWVPDTPEDLA